MEKFYVPEDTVFDENGKCVLYERPFCMPCEYHYSKKYKKNSEKTLDN
jgi:hypothetical protein